MTTVPETPLVSVITVCYNAAGTIAATLDSVRAQTWRPLECVVVDGGSKDGTQDIVKGYADIIGTVAIEPTLQNLGVLAVIVAIRTLLSFALELEVSGRWPWQRPPPAP